MKRAQLQAKIAYLSQDFYPVNIDRGLPILTVAGMQLLDLRGKHSESDFAGAATTTIDYFDDKLFSQVRQVMEIINMDYPLSKILIEKQLMGMALEKEEEEVLKADLMEIVDNPGDLHRRPLLAVAKWIKENGNENPDYILTGRNGRPVFQQELNDKEAAIINYCRAKPGDAATVINFLRAASHDHLFTPSDKQQIQILNCAGILDSTTGQVRILTDALLHHKVGFVSELELGSASASKPTAAAKPCAYN